MPSRYLIFNKPFGVLCQFTPGTHSHERTLKEFIPIENVYPVGRLDQDSEGLMLLTDDGDLQHRLTDPKHESPKTYLVQVERLPDEAALRALRAGVLVQGTMTRPADARLMPPDFDLPPRTPPIRFRKNVSTAWLEITLREGRNRQVRRMTASVGFPTLRLIRTGIATLRLGELASGEWRELSTSELVSLSSDSSKDTKKVQVKRSN